MSELKVYTYDDMLDGVADVDAEYYLKSEADKVIAHHKYERCLAMASNCRLRARWFGDNSFYKKEQWALQWHRRWLKLAEKLKNKEAK